jgi:hypothetical protein
VFSAQALKPAKIIPEFGHPTFVELASLPANSLDIDSAKNLQQRDPLRIIEPPD